MLKIEGVCDESSVQQPNVCVKISNRSHLLCSYLDELLEKLHSLTELTAQADLSDHPQLNLVEPAQKQVQIGCSSPEVLSAKCVVQQLVLEREWKSGHFLSFASIMHYS